MSWVRVVTSLISTTHTLIIYLYIYISKQEGRRRARLFICGEVMGNEYYSIQLEPFSRSFLPFSPDYLKNHGYAEKEEVECSQKVCFRVNRPRRRHGPPTSSQPDSWFSDADTGEHCVGISTRRTAPTTAGCHLRRGTHQRNRSTGFESSCGRIQGAGERLLQE